MLFALADYFLSLGSVPQLLGEDTLIFGGTAPIFGGTASIFGAIAPELRRRDRERAYRATKLCHLPQELEFAPENPSV